MSTKIIAVGGLVLGLIALGWISIKPSNTTIVNPPPEQTVGAIPSANIASQYLSWGGVPIFQYKIPMTSASTTQCNILKPTGAAKLLNFTATFSTATTSSTWTLATSSTPNALGKKIRSWTTGGGAVTWNPGISSSTAITSDLPYLTGLLNASTSPSIPEYLNFGIETGSSFTTVGGTPSGSGSIAGTCTAIFQMAY